jgi:hypothetical protein
MRRFRSCFASSPAIRCRKIHVGVTLDFTQPKRLAKVILQSLSIESKDIRKALYFLMCVRKPGPIDVFYRRSDDAVAKSTICENRDSSFNLGSLFRTKGGPICTKLSNDRTPANNARLMDNVF